MNRTRKNRLTKQNALKRGILYSAAILSVIALTHNQKVYAAESDNVQGNSTSQVNNQVKTPAQNITDNDQKQADQSAQNVVNQNGNNTATNENWSSLNQATNKIAASDPTVKAAINNVTKKDKYYEVDYASGQQARLYLLNDKTFRYYVDPTKQYGAPDQSGKDLHAEMFVENIDGNQDAFASFKASQLTKNADGWDIGTSIIDILFNKNMGTMKVNKGGKTVFEETKPISITKDGSTQYIKDGNNVNYYGGGTQDGKFVLKGQDVKIENENAWVDGAVTSPNPFYWSIDSNGQNAYGVIRDTFRPGIYSFDSQANGEISTTHSEDRFDAIYFFGDTAYDVIKTYQELTGMPAMMPQYGFYEAHLNAYNRDFWVQVDANTKGAIKFSDGKYYKEYQPGKVPNGETGIKESLNGEKNNYQFSARAVIDNYLKNDMPIGWFLPNDGYGAGYGQTDSLEGNLKNLADFIEYANFKGIQVGLWTQQNLAPVDPNNPKPDDRDFAAEVNDGVVALKTDVAWVGNGYSFGLDGLQKATDMLNSIKGDLLRPFIITLDGWAGTQRYAGIWTGDEVGGNWEYIRFQIPTYIGEGLSGQPYVGSDMDGIFGGGDPIINARDYEWKTFSPIQLNMDGWGENPKNPYTFGGKTEDINRAYLKLKSMMMPYNYTMDHEAATEAKPMVRALLLDYPNIPATYTNLTKYEYLWGDNFLIAPIYQDTAMDKDGNDIRNGIYLPDPNQIWVDYFTGKEYRGGQVINGFDAPIWKLPVFVKKGAIVPKTAAHNTPRDWNKADREFEIFPANGNSNFTVYEDDGISKEYLKGKSATTDVTSSLSGDHLTVNVGQLTGNYKGMVKDRTTEFDIKTTKAPTTVTAKVGGSDVALKEAKTLDEFNKGTNMYYFDQDYLTDSYLKDLGTGIAQSFLRVKLAATDATTNRVVLNVDGIKQESDPAKPIEPSKDIAIPSNVVKDASKSDYSHLAIKWDPVTGATTYNVKADGVLYNGIKDPNFALSDLIANSDHTFQVQSVVGDKVSNWSEALTLTTDADPLVNAVKVQSESVISSNIPQGVNIWQAGTPLSNMFDLNLTDQTHSNWAYTDKNTPATPMTIQVNLGAVNSLDSFEYVPRTDGGYNGILNHIILNTSVDGMHWTTSAEDTWARASQQPHMISFKPGTKAQFVNIVIPAGAGYGGFVSGNEMLFFKTPGTNGYMRGDITNDGNIDQNDITSLQNYAGLTAGIDSDFGGYVEKADLNQNGVIDAFDINYVSVLQSPQITHFDTAKPAGSLSLTADKDTYNVGDTVTLTVSGHNLANVNALSMKIPYSSKEIDIQDIASTKATSGMLSFSRKRTHSNGQQDIYVIFANQGEQPRLSGDADLATIKFTAKAPLNKKDLQFAILDPEFVDQWSSEFTPTASAPISISVNGTEINPDVEAKQALQTKVDDAKKLVEKDYTADSWKTLNDALTKAEDVLTNTASKAADYTKVSDVLTKAQDALVKAPITNPDAEAKQALQTKVDEAKKLVKKDYTADSWKNFNDALTKAEDVLANTASKAADYTKASDVLTKAQAALVKASTPSTDNPGSSNPSTDNPSNPGSSTDTNNNSDNNTDKPSTDKPDKDSNEETSMTGVVYIPEVEGHKGWKVALLDKDGKYTGKFIATDSNWKVFAKKTIGGTTYYRIGTQKQWVPAKFANVVNDANKPEEETPVSGVAYVPVIRHMKNYRVALLDTDGNYTGKFISTDSSWKVLAVKVINGEKMLRIGTQEQWVPMKFTDFNI